MPTYRFTVRYGVAGSAVKSGWTNVFHIAIADVITSAAIVAAADALVGALRKTTLDSVTLRSVTVKDPASDGAGYDATKVRTIAYNQAGQKLVGVAFGEPKQIVVKLQGNAESGRAAHNALRMAILDSESTAGGDGNPSAAGEPSGVADTIVELNDMIAAGTEFHAYSKLKSGAVSDRNITSFSYAGVGARTARRAHKKRGTGSKPSNWISDAKSLIETAIQLGGNYALAKEAVAALRTPALEAAVPALTEAAETILPLLAL